MSYICKVTDTSIICGYGFNHNRDHDKYFYNNYNFVITFENNIMQVKYTFNQKTWTTLDYPFISYKIHCLSVLKNLFLIELEMEELDKNRLIFVLDVIATPSGIKGPHFNGPVLQYFYLNKELVIDKQIKNYDCKELTNIYNWFERNKDNLFDEKKSNKDIKDKFRIGSYRHSGIKKTFDTSFNVIKLTKNYYLVITFVFYFLIDTTFEDDNYCEQVYWLLCYPSPILNRGYLIELLSDNFKPEKLDLCQYFLIDPFSVQLEYYDSVFPSYKLFNFI